MISGCVSKIIKNWGRPIQVVLENDKEEKSKAFIQPFRHKDYSHYGGNCTNIGFNSETEYLYIGPKDIRIDKYPFNTIIKTSDESYIVKRAQKVCFKEDVLYIWAILQRHEEVLA